MNDNAYSQGAQVAGSSMMSFVLGAVVGASLALLLAPETGADTRNRLRDVAKRVGQRVRHSADDLATDAREAMDAGRQEFQKSRSTV
jgi:gas vesicle protein